MIDEATSRDIDMNFHEQDVGAPVTPCAGPAKKHIVRVVQWKSQSYNRTLGAEAKSTTHMLEKGSVLSWSDPWNLKDVKKGGILSTMEAVHKGDIFTSDTHGLLDPKTLTCVGIDSTNGWNSEIWLAELLSHVDKGNPPAVAVIFGCKTAELLKGVVTKIPVAFGISGGDISAAGLSSQQDNANAADAATAALMIGKTLNEVQAAATAQITFSATNYGASIAVETAAGIALDKNLEDNGLV